ncbi:type VI immunity family protein [Caballeronia sp. LZ019]|uniref:type VI immunity family protein n=1 Tax=Caballeronia sp. LZ019 TaxID=3038555 RepID=UPI0028552286|nr:type VI immunity family protein [Caballeronia sp. LZ019]MDR5809817.1 DUF3396 domain-containing protein [Caballeronia sp. LZ019]
MDNAQSGLDITDADGDHLVRYVMKIVFYLRHGHPDVGRQVEHAVHAFADLVSVDALRFFADAEGEWRDLREQNLAKRLEDQWGHFADTLNADVVLRGQGRGAADFYLRYAGNMRAGQDVIASSFQCWVPRAYWLENRINLAALTFDIVKCLPFSFGYVSPAIVGGDSRRLQRLARRYLTVDIAEPRTIGWDIGDLAGGAYWYTFLGPRLTEAVRGVEGLREALPRGVTIDEIEGGRCGLLLSPSPILGDVNRREDISVYRSVAAYFDQCGVLHVPKRVVYFKDDAGMADFAAQRAWHRRLVDTTTP